MASISSVTQSSSLTKHPTASVRELFTLSLPLVLVLLSGCLMGLCNQLFLAHYSLQSFEGCVNAVYLCSLFQLPLVRITSMGQVFVGFHKGANQPHLIGRCIWQMIWFSLFSILLTLPLASFAGPFFLHGTSIEDQAMIYFRSLMAVNFLYPLAAALSSFFIAEGKTRPLFLATLATQAFNILLDYLLIFGIDGVLAPQGIFGAALATGIAQGTFCLILFVLFIQKKYREQYKTDDLAFQLKPFWNYVRVGIPRAVARMLLLVAWAATARIMTLKGGDFLIALSVGSTLFLFFAFINEGMGQAIMAVASRLIGAKEYPLIRKLRHSAFLLLSVTMTLLTLPFFIFPDFLLSFFFVESPAPETLEILRRTCVWLWFLVLCNGVNMIGFSLISAACDTVFHMMANCLVWLTSYLPVYLLFKTADTSPDLFWLIVALDALALGLVFHWRASKHDLRDFTLKKCNFLL